MFIEASNRGILLDFFSFLNKISFQELGGDLDKYPEIAAWFERCKRLPSATDNFAGAKMMGDFFRSISKDKI